jgi:sarcosine oxidase
MYQPHTSGHVSPRSQVRAQATVAAQQGAQVIVETVRSVRQQGDYVEVSTDAGHVYRAAHVLIAAGGFSNTQQLLPRPLEILVYARTIVLMELGSVDHERLQHMPSIIYKPRDPDERCYILPPIRYPDGKYYLKIGGSPGDPTIETLDELGTWFRSSGREAAAQHLLAKLHRIIPGLQPVVVRTESCVTTFTPSEQIYADKLAGGRIGVLTGGNGSAAKSADEIGRIGALMMQHEQWVYDLEAQQFRARFRAV